MPNKNPNFARLDVAALIAVRDEVEQVLARKVDEERRDLQARLDALHALQSGERASGVRKRKLGRPARLRRSQEVRALKGRKVPIKYRGPKGDTWTGRGLAPRWLAELEAKGKKRKSFLV
jgi:DNA-binding protein H-NS